MIKLTLTEEQAKIVSLSCEFYTRIRIGLWNEITYNFMDIKRDDYCEARDAAEYYLLEARKYVYPDLSGIGHSYGVGKFEDADIAYDVHQVLRHALGDSRTPWSMSQEKLPVCEKVN